jgi:hypothetical protein
MNMSKQKKYSIRGTVTNKATGKGIPNLVVEAWDKDLLIDDLLGSTKTDTSGTFILTFDESYYEELCFDRKPDIFFKVYYQGKLLARTEDSVLWNVQKRERVIDISISMAQSRKQYTVRGTVTDSAGNQLPQLTVRAFARYLRKEVPLGEGQTDGEGRYNISYFVEGEGGMALVMQVQDNEGKVFHQTGIYHDVTLKMAIDIHLKDVFPGFNLFQRMVQAIEPLLEEELAPAQLEQDQQHDDIAFLAGKTGYDASEIVRLIMAHRLVTDQLPAEFWFALLGEEENLLARKESITVRLDSALDSLATLDSVAVNKALTRSINRDEISRSFKENISQWLEAFIIYMSRRPVTVIETKAPTFIQSTLMDAGIKEKGKQETFVQLFNRYRTITPELLQTLEKDNSFTPAEIDDLHTSYRLAELTRGDFSVVKAIKEEFNVRTPAAIGTLAKKSKAQWVELVKRKQEAGEMTLSLMTAAGPENMRMPEAEIFAGTLERQFREAFPTMAFSGGLERAIDNGSVKGLKHAQSLGRLLEVHTDFELLKTPVEDFFNNNLNPDLEPLAQDTAFRQEVKAVQRVFKLSPTFEATDVLLADDMHSAQKVYRMGRTEFVRHYSGKPGFTAETAALAWDRAAETQAAVLTFVGDIKALQSRDLPQALKTGKEELSDFPYWNNLFKSGDLCECEHCRSVLSPAAYFTDLMMFLKDRSTRTGHGMVKDVLLIRRPDLGYLELNCQNAMTPLPYVDVVCEVLEDVVDADDENHLELTGFYTMPGDTVTAVTQVSTAFDTAFTSVVNDGKEKIKLGDSFTISQVTPSDPDLWVIHGESATYLLMKKSPASHFYAKILRNTKSDAEQLRAYPQYVNPKAYNKLKTAQYPWTLPFDLFGREVRAAFKKTNLNRWELMETLRGTAAPYAPSESDVAAEYFGISTDATAPTDEKRIILEAAATAAEQKKAWGVTGADWLTKLANVNLFLDKTGLEYNQMLAILDLPFINPKRDIQIHHEDSSCDTDKKTIQPLNAATLDRIHRFLRLWRKLDGWKMWELDLAIRKLPQQPISGKGKLNETFLVNLFYLCRIKKKLGKMATVEHLCALFGDFNTESRFTQLHQQREEGLYHHLFLDKRLFHSPDPAFIIDVGTGALPVGNQISAHHPVVLAVLGIPEPDLILLKGLTTVNHLPNTMDNLTLENLSILWRHSWLAKGLKFKVNEWAILLKLFHGSPLNFPNTTAALAFLNEVDGKLADPRAVWELLELIDRMKATGYKPHKLDWLLAANHSSKAALKEQEGARFLLALRKELQAIKEDYDPSQYEYLTALPPTDSQSLSTLLASLLQKMLRTEEEVANFVATLRGRVVLEANGKGIPTGFFFPPTITGTPNHIPIQYDAPNNKLRFTGLMSEVQRNLLTGDSSAAMTALDQSGQLEAVVQGPLPGFVFPATITGAPNNIPIQHDEPAGVFRFNGLMTAAQQSVLLSAAVPVSGDAGYQKTIKDLFTQSMKVVTAYRGAIEYLYQESLTADSYYMKTGVSFPGGVTLPPALPSLPIRYNSTTQIVTFTGLMTEPERTALIASGNPATVVDELFILPRLGVKFYKLEFETALTNLPGVDFKAQLSKDLADRIAYNAEKRVLRFSGIMSNGDRDCISALSADADYVAAVNDLAAQARTIAPPDDRIWLRDTDLDDSLPTNDTFAKRLANAIGKALDYFRVTLTNDTIIQQCSAQLGLTEPFTQYLLTQYALFPDNLLEHLTGTFSDSMGVVDYANQQDTFDGWYWANRVASLLMDWKITLPEWQQITGLTAGMQLLDIGSMPLEPTAPMVPLDRFLALHRLISLRDRQPETEMTVLNILVQLQAGNYATAGAFAADVELINNHWPARDVETFTALLDLTYPVDYLTVNTWERLERAFYFLDRLNSDAATTQTFAAPAMTLKHSDTIKELLCARFGADSWITLSGEIQDVLRESKRDALTSYLLTLPKPTDAPSGKWENCNDLYAYYLLDVEIGACQLTSRLVQGSGSVQLFVQRCFMGLEPHVKVITDGDTGDSAWKWWKWMRKYRVWEANRKVFLWPENWIEPELKKDRSSFFKDMENELMQNEINQYNVETAFSNYLEKLDGVAQLEIAGYYHEDDGDNTIMHTFGRTTGAEPHIYYYRRFDYRQWTPWEKVNLDIQGDYLVPAVLNKRLFLFWPVFTEIPDEKANDQTPYPTSGSSMSSLKAQKKLRLQMAVSDYRQDKWTPKRVSTDYDETCGYSVEIVKKNYNFYFLDRSSVDGRVGVKYEGSSLGSDGNLTAPLEGTFEIAGCNGVPVLTDIPGNFQHAVRPRADSTGNYTEYLKWVELGRMDEFFNYLPRLDGEEEDFTLENGFYYLTDFFKYTRLLNNTPGIFKMTPPWHYSYMDKISMNGNEFQAMFWDRPPAPMGSWLPFFYNDKKRTFLALPSFYGNLSAYTPEGMGLVKNEEEKETETKRAVRNYYPDIKKFIRQWEDYYENMVLAFLNAVDLTTLSVDERDNWEQFLHLQFPYDSPPLKKSPPSYSDKQVKELFKRYSMRLVHIYLGTGSLFLFTLRQYHFKNYYHPFVCDFAKLVYNPLKGIPALMSRDTQFKTTDFDFQQLYQPAPYWVVKLPVTPNTVDAYPREEVDFSPDGAYAPYNWELFFHAPLLIANSLSKNQRFEEARQWYHFIFNPIGVESEMTGGSAMSKYWITKPFFITTDPQYKQQRIDNILQMLAGDTSVPGSTQQTLKNLEDQVKDWRTNPFEPHRIANYRTVAYQKTVVMKYLDNLIDWGDYLFRQDSMESINEATQLYIMAAEILGPRPKKVPPRVKPPMETFNEMEHLFDNGQNRFGDPLIELENLVPVMPGNNGGEDPAPLPVLYFCIPSNEKMLGYWDTVADRLYKIRHCMNIEGVVRQLSLFEPPIDPGALVKAVAGGLDISAALADMNAPLPLYRFNSLLQKANEVCNDVKALGGALLTALEKKDAEVMALLRQGQEIRTLEAVTAIKELQIKEMKVNLEGVKKNKELITLRRDYYRDIEKISAEEALHQEKLEEAYLAQQIAQVINIAASVAHIVPTFDLGVDGFGGSPRAAIMFGGPNVGSALQAAAGGFSFWASSASHQANKASINAGHERRWDEWKHQENLANKELEQIDKTIAATELRINIAEKELENHKLQIENAKATDDFMRNKYTNKELYQWQVGQISGVYFQSYRLAYDMAKQAERCYRFELGVKDSNYINFGYWDSLKKGLLSGEKLQYDLRRLETAYMEQNQREFELIKHISLALSDPLALVKLKETGRCFISLPEEIFDLDFPGHYFRRIKSVSLTLPCIVGPYKTVSCTLRLLKNSIRIDTSNGDNGYPRNVDDQFLPAEDTRFVENNIPVKAIAISNVQNDSGVFELNFRDERYLPFEGAGVISDWSLELFNDLPANNPDPSAPDFGKALRQFDYDTISDVILHIKYTAREDAGVFKNRAVSHLRDYFQKDDATPSLRMFSLSREFPNEWHSFLNPTDPLTGNIFQMNMSMELFPHLDQGKTLKVNTVWILTKCSDAGNYEAVLCPPLPAPPPAGSDTMILTRIKQYGGLHYSRLDISALGIEIAPKESPVTWKLKLTPSSGENLQVKEVEEIFFVLGYEWE